MNWHFNTLTPSNTLIAVDPHGTEFVVKHGKLDSDAGRKLFNAMASYLSGDTKLIHCPPPNNTDK
jgi:hypothetical protein